MLPKHRLCRLTAPLRAVTTRSSRFSLSSHDSITEISDAWVRRSRKDYENADVIRAQAQHAIFKIVASNKAPSIFAVCVDGFDPQYVEDTPKESMPFIKSLIDSSNAVSSATATAPSDSSSGVRGQEPGFFIGDGAMPSFTNPNNVGIITASPPSKHGISGNYYFDSKLGKDVPMTSASMIRADSLLAAAHLAGFDVIVVTAKDKLLNLLSHQLPATSGIASASATLPEETLEITDQPAVIRISMESVAASAPSTAGEHNAPTSVKLSSQTTPDIRLLKSLLQWPEPADTAGAAKSSNGSKYPSIYDPEISHAVIAAGRVVAQHLRSERERKNVRFPLWSSQFAYPLATHRPVLAYLSTTDYVQHKHAPGSSASNVFCRGLDEQIGKLTSVNGTSGTKAAGAKPRAATGAGSIGVVQGASNIHIGITADHGMNNKFDSDGAPNIHFVEDAIVNSLRASSTHFDGFDINQAMDCVTISSRQHPADVGQSRNSMVHILVRATLPITDAHIVHHGALGGYCCVHVDVVGEGSHNPEQLVRLKADFLMHVAQHLESLYGIARVLSRTQAAYECELPSDRIGDLIVIAESNWVLGKSRCYHQSGGMLDAVAVGLRSHGSWYERIVPMIFTGPVTPAWRNYLQGGGRPGRNWHLLPVLLAGAASAL